MAVVTGSYTIAGGLKAVIVTDVIQSITDALSCYYCSLSHLFAA